MKYKRKITIALTALMVIGTMLMMSGCGDRNNTNDSTPTEQPQILPGGPFDPNPNRPPPPRNPDGTIG